MTMLSDAGFTYVRDLVREHAAESDHRRLSARS
ncbi:MAG: hypothetical protein QOD62_2299 [Actinomycetota bacterium]|jgi:hypothetical protein|nr:hypothetical protein [Actinomycetota bacterium]